MFDFMLCLQSTNNLLHAGAALRQLLYSAIRHALTKAVNMPSKVGAQPLHGTARSLGLRP